MTQQQDTQVGAPRRAARLVLWLPGLLVALGAAVATAHGLYEVARAADTPPVIAGLYPLITDGLALVAYAATARLAGRGRRYAWIVVVLAAGLSGLAQASYLAHGAVSTSTVLRFGIGAWPAVAAAIVAHLLFLIAHAHRAQPAETTASELQLPETNASTSESAGERQPADADALDVQPTAVHPVDVERATPAVQPGPPVQPAVQPSAVRPHAEAPEVEPSKTAGTTNTAAAVQDQPASSASPARERARHAALRHQARHGDLPTVTQLMSLADVARGTAGTALKQLREQPRELHLIHDDTH